MRVACHSVRRLFHPDNYTNAPAEVRTKMVEAYRLVSESRGSGAPGGTGFTTIFSTPRAFAALDEEGRIHAWGSSYAGGYVGASGNFAGSIQRGVQKTYEYTTEKRDRRPRHVRRDEQ